LNKGLIHVYTGKGNGKTTAAIGLGLRASGANLKVCMIQFMKKRKYSELKAIDKIDNFTYFQYGRDNFVNKDKPEEIDIDLAQKGFQKAKKIIKSNEYDLVILDEINVAIDYKLIELDDVLDLIENKPDSLEILLTGRSAHPEIVKIADYASEILEIKHPFKKGIKARKGIEY